MIYINKIGKCRAYSNIALIKYWGKEDEDLILPKNSSISMTLDAFYTDTLVEFREDLEDDVFILNGEIQTRDESLRVSKFLDLFREEYKFQDKGFVKSINHLPTAAGLASSASAFAALAGAVDQALKLNLGPEQLSRYARRGSGSASRSIHGGFVRWNKGSSDRDSVAEKISDGDFDIGMLIVLVNKGRKKISSREGMKRTVETSPFYEAWLKTVNHDLENMERAIKLEDIEKIGSIAEKNAFKMHGSMMGANPPIYYLERDSILALDIVKELRDTGILAYATMDAGPNVKVICRLQDRDLIVKRFMEDFSSDRLVFSGVGPGIERGSLSD